MSWEGMTIMIISMCYEAFEVMKESLNAIMQHFHYPVSHCYA